MDEQKHSMPIFDEKMLEIFTKKYGEPIGYGLTAVVYTDGQNAIKVFYKTTGKQAAFREAFMMANVERSGIEAPRALKLEMDNGYWVLHMTRVHGQSMLEKVLFALSTGKYEDARNLIVQLTEIEVTLSKTRCAGIPKEKDVVRGRISESAVLTEDEKQKVVAYMGTLPDGDGICHGDFHPNQVMLDETGKYTVIDWTDMGSGAGAADAATTWLNIKYAPAAVVPLFEKAGLADLFLETYVALSGTAREEIEAWLPVQAALLMTCCPPYREILQKYLQKLK